MQSEWVRKQLSALGEINSSCTPHLHKLLRERNQISLWADEETKEKRRRGAAIFAAFDPWETCLRVSPRSFKYFRAAEKQGTISVRNALDISRTLLKSVSHLKSEYRGHFSYFFEQTEVVRFLNCKEDNEHLLDLENTFGACADVLYEAVPWPVHPDRHLVAGTSTSISFDREPSATPIDALTDAIELASWGPWIGLPHAALRDLIDIHAQPNVSAHGELAQAGQKIMIPFFSQGLQGVVVGLFIDIDDSTAQSIRTELLQFGQTMSDKWSILRNVYFWETVRDYRGDIIQLARALLHMISPVDYVIVEVEGRMEGYKLRKEDGYWAGYRRLKPDEVSSLKQDQQEAKITLENVILPKSLITIKTLPDNANLDAFFAKMRLEMLLRNPLGLIQLSKRQDVTVDTVNDMIRDMKAKLDAGHQSLSTYRQLYVLEKIAKHFRDGNVSVTNNDLKEYLGKFFGDGMKSGYQISSHGGEIEKLFETGITVEKSRIGLNISWNP